MVVAPDDFPFLRILYHRCSMACGIETLGTGCTSETGETCVTIGIFSAEGRPKSDAQRIVQIDDRVNPR